MLKQEIFIGSLLGLAVFSGAQTMKIWKKSGIIEVPAAEIDSVTFISSSSGSSSGAINLGTLIDSRDGKTYKTVVIGTQRWMAENLNTTPATGNSWCYDDNSGNCTTYGRLYDWATAMALPASCNSTDCASSVQLKHQGICPSAWHIPTDAEWKTLEMHIGMSSTEADLSQLYRGTVATKLKSITGWSGTPGNGTDILGFSALPAGYRNYIYGSFAYLGFHAFFWSASQSGMYDAWGRSLDGTSAGVFRYYYGKSSGFSVRCIQD